MTLRRQIKFNLLLPVLAVAVMIGALFAAQKWVSGSAAERDVGTGKVEIQSGSRSGASASGLSSRQSSRDEPVQRPYDPAPDFERMGMDGSVVKLSSFRGSVVVLNFWATWCAPCRVEIPEFIKMHRQLDGVQFIGVSLDEEGFDVVRPFAEEMGIPYPLVIGDDALTSELGGVMGLPTTYVIDREGRIRQRFVGMVNEKTLRPVLTDLLSEGPASR